MQPEAEECGGSTGLVLVIWLLGFSGLLVWDQQTVAKRLYVYEPCVACVSGCWATVNSSVCHHFRCKFV
jgi:hypothetical protein